MRIWFRMHTTCLLIAVQQPKIIILFFLYVLVVIPLKNIFISDSLISMGFVDIQK